MRILFTIWLYSIPINLILMLWLYPIAIAQPLPKPPAGGGEK